MKNNEGICVVQQLKTVAPVPCRRLQRIHTVRTTAAYREGIPDITAAVRQKVGCLSIEQS